MINNPYMPGTGFRPPHLAGRSTEQKAFLDLLKQDIILKNMVITGLRGVGKSVLLDDLKPRAIAAKWLWVGSDWSESASITEDNLANRLLTDLSPITSSIVVSKERAAGFYKTEKFHDNYLTYDTLMSLYKEIPGLTADKLKAILEFVWKEIADTSTRGIIFAYDEAQLMSDHAATKQYPLAVLLEVFQSLQRKNVRFMLALVGLPTLVTKLVASRTYAERMFNVVTLGRLDESNSREAILRPLGTAAAALGFADEVVSTIIRASGGYPYFLQFISHEVFDIFAQRSTENQAVSPVPMKEIVAKLDRDFFIYRWNKATDRQRELLRIIASLEESDDEFTIQQIVEASKGREKPFGTSQVNQMLSALSNAGMVYKDKHGKYCFAVPLLADYIRRQGD